MTNNPPGFLAPLPRFVLEVLPWILSGMIGLYLVWGFLSGPTARAEGRPAVTLSAVGGTQIASTSLLAGETR